MIFSTACRFFTFSILFIYEGGVGMRWSVAIMTTSYSGFRDENEETSVQVVRELIEEELLGEIVDDRVVRTDLDEITAALIETSEYYQPDLVITIGGIGLTAYDVTPEATLKAIDRQVPGIAEAMRSEAMSKNPQAMLTRAVCGVRNRTLIINLPNTPKSVHEQLSVIINQLPIALQMLRDE